MKKTKVKSPNVLSISAVLKKLPAELTTITVLSKSLAVVLFIVLPFVGFFLGARYEQWSRSTESHNPLEFQYNNPPKEQVACTLDALECPDGSTVGRSGPDCQFICPVSPVTDSIAE